MGNNDVLNGHFWHDLLNQGGPLGKALNVIPGMNAGAAFHDDIFNQNYITTFNAFTNYGTMLPAAVVTYGSLLDGPLAVQFSVNRSQ